MSELFLMGAALALMSVSSTAAGRHCIATHILVPDGYCTNSQYCCGRYNNECCGTTEVSMGDFIGFLVFMLLIIGMCACCYRCCCRPTIINNSVRVNAPNTGATNLPPQQVRQQLPNHQQLPQQTPYPNMLMPPHGHLLPQQSPYPNMPVAPPGYNQAVGMHKSTLNPNYMG